MTNNGIFNNQATGFVGNDGTFDNSDTLNNNNQFDNYGTLHNLNSGVLTNTVAGVINNTGNGFVGNDGTLNNSGAVNNNTCSGATTAGNTPNGNPINNIQCTATPTSTGTITATFTPTVTYTATYTLTPSPTTCVLTATAPTLLSPAHRAHLTDTTPTFTWSDVSGETSYRLMIYTADRSFVFKKRVFVTNYTLKSTEALVATTYQWRVRSQDTVCDRWTPWSKRNTLFVD
jgi:hypothetical protein